MARHDPHDPAPVSRCAAVLAIAAMLVGSVGVPGSAQARTPVQSEVESVGARQADDLADRRWIWPLTGFRLEAPYIAPAHRYGAGHRGVDLRPLDSTQVRAPAEGTIAFSGVVADRAIVTIDHGDGLVTTLEPIESSLEVGTQLLRGTPVGSVALGGHTEPGALHFGVRLDGEYINPLLLLGGVPRAVLLPCC